MKGRLEKVLAKKEVLGNGGEGRCAPRITL